MEQFMPEAFTMPLPDMIRELQDMGVEQTLISHAEADPRLLAGLYLYVHVEAMNMPDAVSVDDCMAELQPNPWGLPAKTRSCRSCDYAAEGKWDGANSVPHTCGL